MLREVTCKLCGVETDWPEPYHFSHLPKNHPKRAYATTPLCADCTEFTSPPAGFDDWGTVRMELVPCCDCGEVTIRWVGTADWTDPEVVGTLPVAPPSEAHLDSVLGPFETPEQAVVRITSICRTCAASRTDTELRELLATTAAVSEPEPPMWEEDEDEAFGHVRALIREEEPDE